MSGNNSALLSHFCLATSNKLWYTTPRSPLCSSTSTVTSATTGRLRKFHTKASCRFKTNNRETLLRAKRRPFHACRTRNFSKPRNSKKSVTLNCGLWRTNPPPVKAQQQRNWFIAATEYNVYWAIRNSTGFELHLRRFRNMSRPHNAYVRNDCKIQIYHYMSMSAMTMTIELTASSKRLLKLSTAPRIASYRNKIWQWIKSSYHCTIRMDSILQRWQPLTAVGTAHHSLQVRKDCKLIRCCGMHEHGLYKKHLCGLTWDPRWAKSSQYEDIQHPRERGPYGVFPYLQKLQFIIVPQLHSLLVRLNDGEHGTLQRNYETVQC